MIRIKTKGSFKNTETFLKSDGFITQKTINLLHMYGSKGVLLLKQNTPIDSGITASSWGYKIEQTANVISLIWTNTNLTQDGVPIAILVQYGHATKNGLYIQGHDFINPALKSLFVEMSNKIWGEVIK